MPAEIPGTTWAGPARWYSTGRDGKAPRFIVIHYTAGAEGRDAAENGAAYDRRRSDQVSTHFFVDSDSIVQEVLIKDRAYAAFAKGNRLGIQVEICGTLQTRAQWLDPVSDATLTNTAKLCAELCKRYGFEVRRLSHTEMRDTWNKFPNGPRGIVGHVDCTVAYGEGDHTDPGNDFPWDVLLARVNQFISSTTSSTSGDDDMTPDQERTLNNVDQANWKGGSSMGDPVPDEYQLTKNEGGQGNSQNDRLYYTQRLVEQLVVKVEALEARPAGTVELTAEAAAALGPVVEAAVRKVLADAATP